jgi:hypothetical protein
MGPLGVAGEVFDAGRFVEARAVRYRHGILRDATPRTVAISIGGMCRSAFCAGGCAKKGRRPSNRGLNEPLNRSLRYRWKALYGWRR